MYKRQKKHGRSGVQVCDTSYQHCLTHTEYLLTLFSRGTHLSNTFIFWYPWINQQCTGFVAFSTVTDESIPSFHIEHEGEEAYDNMWQKSRSIWYPTTYPQLRIFNAVLNPNSDFLCPYINNCSRSLARSSLLTPTIHHYVTHMFFLQEICFSTLC